MTAFTGLINGLTILWSPLFLLVVSGGVALGMLLGTLPGISATVGVALLVPYTYSMDPTVALVFLTSMFVGGMYGGASTAVLFNMPGDSDSAMVAVDGYPLTLQGRAGETLTLVVLMAGVGGMMGALALSLLAPVLASVATKLGPVEYLGISVLGLALVTGLGGVSPLKGLVSALLGLALSTIGVAPLVGIQRFSFSISWLQSGFDFVPAVLGAFVMAEVFERSIKRPNPAGSATTSPGAGGAAGKVNLQFPRIAQLTALKGTILRSGIIGVLVGSLPGAGATVASIVGYGTETRFHRKAHFGQGEVRGVVAPQVASSAAAVTTLLPLLVVGIPGGCVAAMLLGVFQIHGLYPGPLLFLTTPQLVYTLFATLLVSNVFIVALGLWEARHVIHLLRIPEHVLLTVVTMLAMLGAYAANNRLTDVWVMLFFGGLGYLMRVYGYSVAALVFGLVLGPIIEPQLLRALLLHGGNPFSMLQRPFGGAMLIMAMVIVVASMIRPIAQAVQRSGGSDS